MKTRRNVARSPVAAAADMSGNAAIANEAPMRLTGTLSKFRAKLTELTLPTSNRDASDVKYRNVSGSIGWLSILGAIRTRNSRTPRTRRLSVGSGRNDVRRMPMSRIARWRRAPAIAPTAAPKMPIRSPSRSVPATMPPLYKSGASP